MQQAHADAQRYLKRLLLNQENLEVLLQSSKILCSLAAEVGWPFPVSPHDVGVNLDL